MPMVRVKDSVVVETNLPRTGRLKDGRTVSNYHLLDKEILKFEGWMDLIIDYPEYDITTHRLANPQYVIFEDHVKRVFEVVERVETVPEKIDQLQDVVDTILEEGED